MEKIELYKKKKKKSSPLKTEKQYQYQQRLENEPTFHQKLKEGFRIMHLAYSEDGDE